VGLKSPGYCDANGSQVGNPASERMQPYYFPFITGRGNRLQGYFDYRPKDVDEAVVAASARLRAEDVVQSPGSFGAIEFISMH
jgi:hypothetical protein